MDAGMPCKRRGARIGGREPPGDGGDGGWDFVFEFHAPFRKGGRDGGRGGAGRD